MAEADVRALQRFENEYVEKYDDLLDYAARFLLMIGEETRGSNRYNEVVNFFTDRMPPFAALETAMARKAPAQDDDEVELFEAKFEKEELRTVVDKILDFLKSELNVTELDDEVIKQVTDAIKPNVIARQQVTADPENDNDKIIQAVVARFTAEPEDYAMGLKGKFLNYVVAKANSLGLDNMIGANDAISDVGKQALSGKELTREAIYDFLSDDANFNATDVNQVADKVERDLADAYEQYISTAPVNESLSHELNFNLSTAKKNGLLTEGLAGMFGAWVKLILKSVFGDIDLPIGVSGDKKEVEAFARAIQGEKRYIDSIQRYGLSNRQTYQSRARLATSIRNFERETGLKWPFK